MKLTEQQIQQMIRQRRRIMHPDLDQYDGYQTDQELKRPQPPLAKSPMRETSLALPLDFEKLNIDNDFLHVINSRRSHRVYTEEQMSLRELSFLLWCSQGVKEVRGRSYATIRTVPGGGARHPFEVYMTIQNVEGLKNGLYHYLPMKHHLECLEEKEDLKDFIGKALEGQVWGQKANVVFFYSFVAYRAEWRYGIHAHRMCMADDGHVTENVYLAATAIGLGGCAVGAVDGPLCDEAFGLDGEEEFVFYCMPAGTVSEDDRQKEKDFYRFVEEEGL
ncbi:MAG: SagB/ThcOx family dehydrogenase [Erysipelotrichaceae bacterium]|nr:SagB/ThcOx family dehydrogenase [Erysipelotrichaceae bacterium]